MEQFHGTTIISVRRNTPQGVQVAIGGDGQVTLGNIVVKGTARKVRKLYHGRLRRVPPWDCGYPWQTPRMQDTAEGFGQPIRQIFEPFFRIKRQLPTAFDPQPSYKVALEDPLWYGLYLPVARLVERVSKIVGLLQQGRISVYLMYSFVTLIVLLLFVK